MQIIKKDNVLYLEGEVIKAGVKRTPDGYHYNLETLKKIAEELKGGFLFCGPATNGHFTFEQRMSDIAGEIKDAFVDQDETLVVSVKMVDTQYGKYLSQLALTLAENHEFGTLEFVMSCSGILNREYEVESYSKVTLSVVAKANPAVKEAKGKK